MASSRRALSRSRGRRRVVSGCRGVVLQEHYRSCEGQHYSQSSSTTLRIVPRWSILAGGANAVPHFFPASWQRGNRSRPASNYSFRIIVRGTGDWLGGVFLGSSGAADARRGGTGCTRDLGVAATFVQAGHLW